MIEGLYRELNELAEMYEQLLEDLPQYHFSKAGTPPEAVIKEVEKNIYLKGITQDDVSDAIVWWEDVKDVDYEEKFKGLVEEIREYFELDEKVL